MPGGNEAEAGGLAGHGFVVAVPEVYHELEPAGTVLPYDTAGAERSNAHKITKTLVSYDADARAALDFLKEHAACTGNLGVVGMCLGGHLAFRAAMYLDVQAGVCFYATDIHTGSLGAGKHDAPLARMRDIPGEMLMVWGRQDPHVPQEGRALIYRTMIEAGLTFSWAEFNAQHAFLRDEGPRCDPELARQCYGMAVDLLRRKLSAGDRTPSAAV